MVELKAIDRDNWETCIDLEVARTQTKFVATNLYSLAQWRFLPGFRAVGIYSGKQMVGFALYGLDPDDGNHWIYRLMVDRHHQGKGYGFAALEKIIARIERLKRRSAKLMIAYHPKNEAARRLYRKAGFREQGVAAWGETMASRKLRRARK
jgi:diamine N-acetyltransferase